MFNGLQSLLHKRQRQWATELLGNLRLSCCVSGGMDLIPAEEDLKETLELIAGHMGLRWVRRPVRPPPYVVT
jgi:hypothetical protein